MPNPYFTSVDPYQMPEQQGLMPVFQNIGQQQANQQAALNQQMANTQQAGMIGKQNGSTNGMAMAAMLRKQDQNSIDAANAEMSAFNNRPAQTYYSAGMNPMNIVSDE